LSVGVDSDIAQPPAKTVNKLLKPRIIADFMAETPVFLVRRRR
jgi:hypothetical protein